MFDEIKKFMRDDKVNNAWLYAGPMELYVRKSQRLFSSEYNRVSVLDLASVTVKPNHRGKGLFTALIDQLEDSLPLQTNYRLWGSYFTNYLYVENVMFPSLQEFFSRRVLWLPKLTISGDHIQHCYYYKHY